MAYSYKRSITIDHTKCGSANSSDFAVEVSFIENTFRTVSNGGHIQNANGYDINFYSDSNLTTPLFYETEKYVATTGECVFWVKIPTLSASVNVVIYIAYGDPGISTFQSTVSSVWNSGFAAVWHFKDGTTLSLTDSTINANNGTKVGTQVLAAAGQIDGCMRTAINTNLSYIYATSSASLKIASKITISFWIKVTNLNSSGACVLEKRNASTPSTGYNYGIWLDSGGYLQFQFYDSTYRTITTSSALSLNVWYYVSVVVDETAGTKILFYLNSSTVASSPSYAGTMPSSGNERVEIGNYSYLTTGQFFMGGYLDDLKISNIPRSSDWVLSEYNNQSNPSTFYSLGAETPVSSPNTSNFFQFF